MPQVLRTQANKAMMTPKRSDQLTPVNQARVEHLSSLANLLDNSIRIPGTGMRVGLDAVIGLIPGIGDAAGGVMSAYIVLQAAWLGTPVTVLLRMLLNVAIESVIGVIPVVGDLFDAGWKANLRNLALLRRSVETPGAARRSSALVVAGVALALLALLVGLGIAAVMVVDGVMRLGRGEAVRY
jgi:hypothetical protein